jgi:hypothetical protein
MMTKNIRRGFLLCTLFWLILSETQAQLNPHPPRIVVSDHPVELMLIDGPPAKVRIPGTQLEFVVNTDRDVFHDLDNEEWYLLQGGHWLKNTMLAGGDWISTERLPEDFLTLEFSSEWPRVAAALPPRKPTTAPLRLVISYEPTELVLIDGAIKLETIPGTDLQFVANTSDELFLYESRYYLLLAGRWFSTKDFKRQWSRVKSLPAVFADIPESHAKSTVLAAVPGTSQAQQAISEAAKPRIAVLDAKDGSELEVPYMGEPIFVNIETTHLQRAVNTPFQVIQHNNYYYLCYQGAWYSSTEPRGPWQVAREVPEAIYTIPPTDPAYNVTFVRLSSFDDTSGQVAYQSTWGYHNMYRNGATVVYGTGWYYPGYYNRSAYWRYPQAYGFGFANPRGAYYPYSRSTTKTFPLNTAESDWEWDLDGNKRRVYDYGPQNYIGSGEYVMPDNTSNKGDGK